VRRRYDGVVVEEWARDLVAAEYRHTTARSVVVGEIRATKSKKALLQGLSKMRMRGLEPPRTCIHTDLNRARLPIPPHPRGGRAAKISQYRSGDAWA
jgi:hypothetical protein